jgi:hypothetical protein
MNGLSRTFVVAFALLAFIVPATGSAHDDRRGDTHLRTDLSGFNEVLGPDLGVGAIFSTGSGRLKLEIDKQKGEIAYELSYEFPDAGLTPLVGAQFVNQAHLHFGQKHTTGGINVWLCQSADTPAPPAVANITPTCPSPSGRVIGTIRPANVLGLAGQGFPDGANGGFQALIDALQSAAIYGNVHTDRFGPGEIRGQLEEPDND